MFAMQPGFLEQFFPEVTESSSSGTELVPQLLHLLPHKSANGLSTDSLYGWACMSASQDIWVTDPSKAADQGLGTAFIVIFSGQTPLKEGKRANPPAHRETTSLG